jgi:hypothetical protein
MRRRKRRPEQRPGRQPIHQSWFRRYRYHVLVAVIASLVFFRIGFDALFQSNWMEARYSEVGYGMTARQVEGILGKPNLHDDDEQKIWSGEGGVIILDFKDGRVSAKELLPIKQPWKPPRLTP